MNRYGLPYMGSKNKIANWVVDVLPKSERLYDLFCGGCAVTHAAMMRGKYEHYHVNDISNIGGAFCDIIKGKLQPDYRWISREDFFRLKDTDPIVKIVWSFGNNGRDYLYGKDREELKKAMHYAVVFGDYSMSDALGIDLHSLSQYDTLEERYRAYKQLYALAFSKEDKIPPPYITISRMFSETAISPKCKSSQRNTCAAYSKKKKDSSRLPHVERTWQAWNALLGCQNGGGQIGLLRPRFLAA